MQSECCSSAYKPGRLKACQLSHRKSSEEAERRGLKGNVEFKHGSRSVSRLCQAASSLTRTAVVRNLWWTLAGLGAVGRWLPKSAAWPDRALGGTRAAMPEV